MVWLDQPHAQNLGYKHLTEKNERIGLINLTNSTMSHLTKDEVSGFGCQVSERKNP